MRWRKDPDDPSDPRASITVDEVQCADCSLGQHADSRAQFCPLIVRHYEPGHELFNAGDRADYVWFVMNGVVGLVHGDDDGGIDELRLPGSTVGLKCSAGGQYFATARTLSKVTACGATRRAYERWVAGDEAETDGATRCCDEITMLRLVRNVTCPNSAHLESIQYVLDSDGYIAEVQACSAFQPRGAIACDQLCATRLNHRRKSERDDAGAGVDERTTDNVPEDNSGTR